MTAAGGGHATGPALLFDQNLAPVLARRLADLYPGSAHVRDAGLAAADVMAALRVRHAEVVAFAADPSAALFVITRGP